MKIELRRKGVRRTISWLTALVLAGVPLAGVAALRTWTGIGDMNWTEPDSTSWDGIYNGGDDVLFTGAGTGTIQVVGTVTPGHLSFTHTAGNTYQFTNGAGQIAASGGFTNAGGGIVQFGNMANVPIGGLSWPGPTFIANGSELRLTRATAVGVSSTVVRIDGGAITFGADNSGIYVVANPFELGSNGGAINLEFTGNQTRYHLTNSISGAGVLSLSARSTSGTYIWNSGLALAGDNSGFTGAVTIVGQSSATWFTDAAAMFPNASGITVRDGGILGAEFALTDALLSGVALRPRGGLGARGNGTLLGVSEPMSRIPAGGSLVLENFAVSVADRYADADSLAMTNNQLILVGRNVAGSPVTEAVGAMSVAGGARLLLRQPSTSSHILLAPSSLATPGVGSSLLIDVANMSPTNATIWIPAANSRPALTNGILPPSIVGFAGGNVLGHFLTYTNKTGDPTSDYIGWAQYTSSDINSATATDLVNIVASAQGATNSTTIYALRLGQELSITNGATVTIASGGVIMTSTRISGGGTLDFGSVPGYISAFNASAQATIGAKVTGSAGLVFNGVTQTLNVTNNANEFTGGIWINGGAVRLVGKAANGNDVTVNAFGRLIAGPGANGMDTIGGLSGSGYVSAWIASAGVSTGMLVVAAPAGTYRFDGIMADGSTGRRMAFTKAGGSTQTLGTNFLGTYTGYTIVSGGVLRVDGTLAGSPRVSVLNGSRLEGTGFIGGSLLVADANSTLAPGHSAGTLTVTGDVTLASGTIFEAEILGSLSGQYDVLAMGPSSTLTLGGATLNVSAPSALPYLSVYPIIAGWGSIDSSTFNGLADGSTFTSGPNQFLINYGTKPGYDDSVTLTVIPEPGSLALPSLIGLLIFLRRRLR